MKYDGVFFKHKYARKKRKKIGVYPELFIQK